MIVSSVKVLTTATFFVLLTFLLVITCKDRCSCPYTVFMEHVLWNFDRFCNCYLKLGILKILTIFIFCSFSLSYFPVCNRAVSSCLYECIL
jgi:hypothetical protein